MDAGELDARIDGLYALPLDEFVRGRDALASALKKEGDRAKAAEVKALVRPSVSAWAVNRLWRVARDEFEALLDAGDALREAQRHALAGGGGGKMQHALAARRSAVTALLGKARAALEEAGHAASAATMQRVEGTLHAVASMGDWAGLGRMAGDVGGDEGGLEGLLAVGAGSDDAAPRRPSPKESTRAPEAEPTTAPRHKATPEPSASESAREHERSKRERAERERRVEEARRAYDEKKRVADAARAERRAAEARRGAAREALDAAQTGVKQAEVALGDARRALDGAEKAARLADREAERAAHAETEADRALDRARVARDVAVG